MRWFLRELYRRDPVLAVAGGLQLVVLAGLLLVAPFDSRSILGLNPWIKPAKFLVSVCIYVWTVAWFLPYAGGPRGLKLVIRWGVAVLMTVENACVVLQSARGVRSHFNFDTGFDAAVFGTMGGIILLNSLLVLVLTVLFFARPAALPRAYLWGIRLGLLLFLLGSVQGALMVGHGSHTVGAADGGPGLPFVNWSTEADDLRVAHAMGLHGLQVLPLFGYWISRRGRGGWRASPTAAVFVFALAYTAVAALLFLQALGGRPVISG